MIRAAGLAAVLLALAEPSIAADCSKFVQNSPGWAGCQAANALEASDKLMTANYNRALAVFEGPKWAKEKQLLVASQRAWSTYRDRECAFAEQLAGERSTQLICKADMAKDRSQFYERLTKQLGR
jgi:uncharacterized protein YecT (DUF1311 family)